MLEPSKEFQEKQKKDKNFNIKEEQYMNGIKLQIILIYTLNHDIKQESKCQIRYLIKPDHLKIGIKGNPPFIDEQLVKQCDSSESYWLVEDEELPIILQKAYKGELWPSLFIGHGKVDPMIEQEL